MAKKIVVPTLDVTVETVETVQSTTQEDTATMETKVDAVEIVVVPVVPVNESATLDVTLAELIAYTPDAIKGAIDEVRANHDVVAKIIGKLPDAMVQATRDALGITDSLDADVDAVKARLGGKVASVIDAIKRDEKWEIVTEYREMLRLINVVNDARTKLGLPGLLVKVGGRIKGAAISQDASVHTRNMTGFMRPGIYAWNSIDNAKVDWIVTNEKIIVNVNGVQTYAGAQGEISLSKIHNDYVIKTLSDSGSRESFPAFLAKMGYPDASVIMLHAKPSFPVES